MFKTAEWHLVDESESGVSVAISPAGHEALATEQRADTNARNHQITAAVIGGLLVGAILIEALRLTFGG